MRLRVFIIAIFALLVSLAPSVVTATASSVTVNINVGSSISNGRGISCWVITSSVDTLAIVGAP